MTQSVMIMAGGTGGHIFPGLAVAETLRQRGVAVMWLGSRHGMEQQVVPKAGIALHSIDVTAIRGKGVSGLIKAPFRVARAIWQARRILRKQAPDSVLSLGGFVAGPGGLAARFCRIPLVVHEQNSVAGLTNRVLARWAARVLCGFPNALGKRSEYVGNPVRASIRHIDTHLVGTEQAYRQLLVLGGSLGAEALNRHVPEALGLMDEKDRPRIVHQAGRGKLEMTRAAYAQAGVAADVVEFIDDMASAYQRADLVVCRAGALTVSELAQAGKPAIYVPYPHAVDDHQTANARVMVKAGAGELMPQQDLNAATLSAVLTRLLGQPDQLSAMARSARARATGDASAMIADACCEVMR